MKLLIVTKSFRYLSVWLLLLLLGCVKSVADYPPAATGHHRVERWRPLVKKICRQYNIEEEFLMRLIAAESGGDPNAISSAYCRGLTQISAAVLGDYFPGVPVERLYDPEFNLTLCAMHLSRLRQLIRQEFPRLTYREELSLTAAAWHAGWGSVRRSRGVPNGPATRLFVRRVMGNRQQFRMSF